MATFADISIRFGADLKGFSTQMQNAQRGLNKTAANFRKVGAGLSLGVTAPLVAIGVAAFGAYSEIEGVQNAFERLATPTLLKDLREATKNTVSDLKLMQAAVKSSNFKIPLEEMATLLEFARRRAKETGENVDFLVNSIVTGIGRKSPLILDNLGISAIALKDALGGASAASASIADVTTAVGKIARKELKGMGADALTLKEIYLQFKTVIANSLGDIGAILAEGLTPAITFAKDLVQGFKDLSPETKKFLVVIGGIAAAVGPLLALAGTILPAIGTGLALLTGPIGLIVAGLTAIGVVIYKNWEPIKGVLIEIANYFVDLYNESTIFRIGVELIVTSFKNLLATGKFIFSLLEDSIRSIGQTIKDNFSGLGEIVKAVLTGDITRLPLILANGFKDGFDVGKDLVGDIKEDFATLKGVISENVAEGLNNALRGKKYELDSDNVDVNGLEKKVSKAVLTGLTPKGTILSFPEINLPEIIDSSEIDDLILKYGAYEKAVDSANAVNFDNFISSIPDGFSDEITDAPLSNFLEKLLDFKDSSQEILQENAENFVVGFGSLVGSIAAGTAGINDIGALLLNSMADIAMQLGKSAIKIGLTMKAIKLSFKTPGAALVAGIALVAFAGLLKGVASSFAGNFASGGIVGGTSFSGDRLVAGVNSGELILNLAQQKNLAGAFASSRQNISLQPSLRYDAGGFRIMLNQENERLNRVT
jgi:hypothetical protein